MKSWWQSGSSAAAMLLLASVLVLTVLNLLGMLRPAWVGWLCTVVQSVLACALATLSGRSADVGRGGLSRAEWRAIERKERLRRGEEAVQ